MEFGMRSFAFDQEPQKNTLIPNEELPWVIIHWCKEHYTYAHLPGGTLPIPEMRAFLEPRLRGTLFSAEDVRTWLRQAHSWMSTAEKHKPGSTSVLLAEYFNVEVAA